jgi:hypothetical protein
LLLLLLLKLLLMGLMRQPPSGGKPSKANKASLAGWRQPRLPKSVLAFACH